MAGDAPKLDQAKLAKMQQSVRIGEFVMFLGVGRKRLSWVHQANCKYFVELYRVSITLPLSSIFFGRLE